MQLSIRPATNKDAQLVANVLNEAMKYKGERGDEAWGTDDHTKDEVAPLLPHTYLAYIDDRIAGTVSLQWEDSVWGPQSSNAGYMHRLAIKDGFHGQGIGKQVVDWALSKVNEQHRHFLRLDCRSSNIGLCRYYEKQGFRRVGTKKISGRERALYEREINKS